MLSFKHNNFITHIGKLGTYNTETFPDSYSQTTQIFHSLQGQLSKFNCTLLNNIERTWFYICDIDNNYQGSVNSRNDYFKIAGLAPETHYIASTGIEGDYQIALNVVLMNYKFTENLIPEQFHFMTAIESLCPIHKYLLLLKEVLK